VDKDGGLVEMKVYDVPRIPTTPHSFKYSLVYVRNGQRLVGYDNHEHRSDHRHFHTTTTSYRFTSIERLIEDFRHDVETMQKE
jgi:Family of unknown function (DUF6516)